MFKRSVHPTKLVDHIHLIRSHRVMLDTDLAALYGVPAFRLNEQVKRNRARFPADFMFRLTEKEFENLTSQFAMSSWGGRRTRPYAFTEQGVAMLSSVLNSEGAIRVNIAIMRAFVKMRYLALTREELAARLEVLEKSVEGHDAQIREVVRAIESLLMPPEGPRKQIGFREKRAAYRVRRLVAA